jgi:hypothetical protein
VWGKFELTIKKNIYATINYFTRNHYCRSSSLAHQFFYSDGSQHQNNLKCGGCDCSYYLAAKGFWNSYLPDGHPHLIIIDMSLKRTFGVLFSTIGLGSLIYNVVLFFYTIKGEGDFKSLLLHVILSLILFIMGARILRKTVIEL